MNKEQTNGVSQYTSVRLFLVHQFICSWVQNVYRIANPPQPPSK